MRFLLAAHTKFLQVTDNYRDDMHNVSPPEIKEECCMNESIEYLLQTCHNFTQWVSNYKNRVSVQINLVSESLPAKDLRLFWRETLLRHWIGVQHSV